MSMKRGILCLTLMAFFALPALAAAEVHGVYVAPKFLVGIQDSGQLHRTNISKEGVDQYSQVVFGGALALGYNFGPKFGFPIRTEVEYALRSNSSHDWDGWGGGNHWDTRHTTNISTLFFNAYFDIDTKTPLTPYIGGGLGTSFTYTGMKGEVDGVTVLDRNRHDTTFAWNAGGGLAYAFTENVAADVGYRFIGTGCRETKFTAGGERVKIASVPYINEFYAGLRLTF